MTVAATIMDQRSMRRLCSVINLNLPSVGRKSSEVLRALLSMEVCMRRCALLLLPLLLLPACSSPPVRETVFDGYTNTSFSLVVNDALISVVLFLDPAAATVAESETPANLLDAVAANAGDLRSGLDGAISLLPESVAAIKGKPVREMTFITSYPLEGVTLPSDGQFKGPFARAKQGRFTRLGQIVAAHGHERERQKWAGAPYRDFDMEGVVCWWGNTGVKTSSDGVITHVLLRGKPKPKA